MRQHTLPILLILACAAVAGAADANGTPPRNEQGMPAAGNGDKSRNDLGMPNGTNGDKSRNELGMPIEGNNPNGGTVIVDGSTPATGGAVTGGTATGAATTPERTPSRNGNESTQPPGRGPNVGGPLHSGNDNGTSTHRPPVSPGSNGQSAPAKPTDGWNNTNQPAPTS